MIKLVVDLMGADNKPKDLIKGAIDAINDIDDLYLYVCGPEDELLNEIKDLNYDNKRIEIVNCNEAITNYDKPVKAFKTKPNSSLIKGLTLAKENDDIKGFVSCGSTGAILVSSTFILGRIGKVRPALSPILGGLHPFCLVDCGANSDVRVDELYDFAKMGKAYMEAYGKDNPKIALLSNGSEEGKGNDLVKECYKLLKEDPNLNFIGNVEGKNLLTLDVDVVVCDGFSGNIALKTIEGTAGVIAQFLLDYAKKNNMMKELGPVLYELKNTYDYNTKGGAVMLGVNKLVMKGHGAGVSETIYALVKQAYQLAKNNLIEKIKENLKND